MRCGDGDAQVTSVKNTEAAESVLTDEEQLQIRRFVRILQNRGVRATLAIAAIDDGDKASEVIIEAVNIAIDELECASREDLVDAAPSLALLALLARDIEVFPPDFYPTEEIVLKCLVAFWDSIRAEVS